jgi:hypothetical protein
MCQLAPSCKVQFSVTNNQEKNYLYPLSDPAPQNVKLPGLSRAQRSKSKLPVPIAKSSPVLWRLDTSLILYLYEAAKARNVGRHRRDQASPKEAGSRSIRSSQVSILQVKLECISHL